MGQEFREELLSNGLDKYLYSLTGELYDAVAKLFKLTNDDTRNFTVKSGKNIVPSGAYKGSS